MEALTIPWALAVPVIIVLAVIVPLWITFHYVTVWLRMRGDKRFEQLKDAELERLRDASTRLEKRIRNLEQILDGESPNWRKK